MNRRLPRILLALLLLGLIAAVLYLGSRSGRAAAPAQSAALSTPAEDLLQSVSEAFSTPMPKPEGEPRLRSDEHIPYLQADEQGCIRPLDTLTRAEVCRILYSLMENPVEGDCAYSDIAEDDPLYPILGCFVRWDILSYSTAAFRPDDRITRAELVTILAGFYPAAEIAESSFSDMAGHWAAAAAENALQRGWLEESETFDPNLAVTRQEFARLMNRVLGRRADSAALMLSGEYTCPFTDLPADNLYYEDLMEAAAMHSFSTENGTECWTVTGAYEPGLHAVSGRLYYVDESGQVLRSGRHLVWDFDSDGRYTTGFSALDDMVIDILCRIVTPGMEGDEDLRAAYLYVKDDHEYILRPQEMYGCEAGADYEHARRAMIFLPSEGGCCYDYAAAFGILARALGYEAYILRGEINEYYEDHGWVIIPEDGVEYIYDPEMEDIRDWRHFDFDLFHIQNYWQPYMYWYDELTVTR